MRSVRALLFVLGLLVSLHASESFAQSQALNGQIEGLVLNEAGYGVPNAHITAVNVDSGVQRFATTSEDGFYRFPILTLGTFRISAEAPNYKTAVRNGIALATGQTVTVDLMLQVGDVSESVTVSGNSEIADVGKTYLGRVMDNREVQNLPLVSRNFYTLALSQPNVTGRPSRGVTTYPMINANGYARRINYQLDGNNASLAGTAGTRLISISESYVDEIQFVTNGFAAEFGNTPGVIANIVTPSGTNDLRGYATYRFRLPSFYSRPFFYPSVIELPDNYNSQIVAAAGGSIIKNRWHWYAGYEKYARDDGTRANRVSTIKPADRIELIQAGLPESIFVPSILTGEDGTLFIARTDLELTRNNQLAVRANFLDACVTNFINGQLNTLHRSLDVIPKDASLGVQLVSFNSAILNEFRFQFTRHDDAYARNELSGSGPTIVIPQVANFGSPDNADRIDPLEKVTQIQDNLTLVRGSHSIKFGGGLIFIDNYQKAATFSRYRFDTIQRYVEATSGINRKSYSTYEQTFGNPEVRSSATYWNLFVQDDWRASRRLKVNYGLRYDLYLVPEADRLSPIPSSRKFNVDTNNVAPRVGIAYAIDEGNRPLILRIGFGLYYEKPWLNMYQRAILRNGRSRFSSFTVRSLDAFAPQFPDVYSGPPRPDANINVDTVSSDFVNLYAIHSNIQVEKALTSDLSVSLGYVHSAGRHIPVYRNINPINPVSYLSDGRGVYGPRDARYRVYPEFAVVLSAESVGVSQYNALTLNVSQRFSRGLQFNIHYTLANGVDDAPEQNLFIVPASVLSDPYNRHLDRGNSYTDQLHTFVASAVAQPTFHFENRVINRLLNNNQFGFIVFANSGERFNIVSTEDIDKDGIPGQDVANPDRPVGIPRNSGKTPPQFNVDFRYSRLFRIADHFGLDVFAEFQNLFNTNCIVQYTNTKVATNSSGELIGRLPDFKTSGAPISQESRAFQLGVRISF